MGTAYTENFTDIQRFNASDVLELRISLNYENVSILDTRKSEIEIISEAKRKNLCPEIVLKDGCLSLSGQVPGINNEKNVCDINIFLPEEKCFNVIAINNKTGNLNIKNTFSNYLKVQTEGINTFINVKTGRFELVDFGESNSIICDLDCNQFYIDRFFGKTQISLSVLPTETSDIRTKDGEIELALPDNNFTVIAKSFNSKLINNMDNTVTDSIRSGKKYSQNNGGVVINIQTHIGDIIIKQKTNP